MKRHERSHTEDEAQLSRTRTRDGETKKYEERKRSVGHYGASLSHRSRLAQPEGACTLEKALHE